MTDDMHVLPEDLDALRAALDAGVDPNAGDENDTPYLSRFAAFGLVEQVRLLLERGAEPCPPDGATLVVALMRGQLEVAELLVQHGASVDHGANGRTALTHAMCYGEPPAEVVAWLLAHGAKTGADSQGTFPVFEAAREGWSETLRQLIAAGADVNDGPIVDFGFGAPTRSSPLGVAMHYRHKAAVALLKAAGAKKDLPPPSFAKTLVDPTLALGAALWEEDAELVGQLIADGADVNGRTVSKEPFLAAAVRLRKPTYVALLLGGGADPNTPTDGKKGEPVLHDAVSIAAHATKPAELDLAMRTVELLLLAGADPNARHKKSGVVRPLMYIDAPARRARIVRTLLAHGLDVNAKEGQRTLIHELADRGDDVELFAELLAKGADVSGKVDGLTLAERVEYCRTRNKKRLAAALASHGAGA
ncbi:MAG: ankyrin repeat domain-containing protein [Myxococcota bacterium]